MAVPAELASYLKKHDVNKLMFELAEALLLERPDKPEQFLVSHLLSKHSAVIDLAAVGLQKAQVAAAGASASATGALTLEERYKYIPTKVNRW